MSTAALDEAFRLEETITHAQDEYGLTLDRDYLDSLITKHFDPAIDGNPANREDVTSFLEPFVRTIYLQQQAE